MVKSQNLILIIGFLAFFSFISLPLNDTTFDLIVRYAGQFGIDKTLALDIGYAESSFNPLAIGKLEERGLYQITPATWEWLCQKIYGKNLDFNLAYDPEMNIKMAMWYLQYLQKSLGNKYSHAALICAYNMGLSKFKKRNFEIPQAHKNKIYNAYYQSTILNSEG